MKDIDYNQKIKEIKELMAENEIKLMQLDQQIQVLKSLLNWDFTPKDISMDIN